jgi:hypothetical protein
MLTFTPVVGQSDTPTGAPQMRPMRPFTCDLPDPSVIDTTLPIPLLDTLPTYVNDLCIMLNWVTPYDPRIASQFIEVSSSSTFETDTIPYCALVDTPATSFMICVEEEGQFYYRVRSMTADGHFSTASKIVTNTHDITPPTLRSIVLFDPGTGDSTWTETRQIKVRYLAAEKFPAFIQLWENSNKPSIISISDTVGTVDFVLSEAEERKTVYARMIDMTGNSGNIVDAGIYYGKGPHNYPNPFSPPDEYTNFVFRLPQAGNVTITIFDLFGDKVYELGGIAAFAGLNDGQMNPLLRWNGRNGKGELVASGGYLCKIKRDNETIKDKIIKIGVIRKK